MKCIEVVKVFVCIKCYELFIGRLLLWKDTPIFTEHLDKQRPCVTLCIFKSTWKILSDVQLFQ